jgi:PAS domain S-box-containing protein
MEDENKTKKQLIEEIKVLRQQGLSGPQFVHPRDKQAELENVPDELLGWETLFNAIGSAIWMLDDKHIIKRSNKAAGEIFHLPVSEMIGKPCWEIVHKTSQPIPQCPIVQASQTKKRESLDLPIGQQWFEIVVDVIFDASGRLIGYIHILSDITGRKRAEEALQTREKQLRAILEASTQSVFLMDKDGCLLLGNTVTAERMKTDMETLKKGSLYDYLPPEVAKSRRRYIQQVIETGKPLRFEDERFGKTILNSIYPVLGPDGQVNHFAVFGMDITEEKKSRPIIEESKRKLAQANAMLQLVLDTIPVRIFWKDLNCDFLGCNRIFAQDAGRQEPGDLIGDNDYNMGWKHQADLYREDDQKVMVSGSAKINYEETQDTPEGNQIWLRTTKVPLRDPEGQVMGILGTYEDITERKAMEERTRESEERYRNLFDNSYATMLVIDPANGRIIDANAAACTYYGYDRERLKEKRITEINTLTSEQVFEEMARAKAEQRNHFNFFHRLANGEVRPVEVYSGPIILKGNHLLYSIVHDISERKKAEEEKERLILALRDALSKIKTLGGLLPICASCKKIRDDKGYWRQIESYIKEHSQADFSHSICPECMKKLYPDMVDTIQR